MEINYNDQREWLHGGVDLIGQWDIQRFYIEISGYNTFT